MAKKRLGKKVVRRRASPKPRVTPLWNLEKDGITYSGLSTWLECREQFALKWIDGLTSKKINMGLEFGSLFHSALQFQFVASPREVIGKLAAFYRNKRITKLYSSREKDTLELVVGLAERTFPHYCKFWEDDDSKIQWIGREEKFSVLHKVPMPDGTTRTIKIQGMRDGLYESRNVFGVFETKTKSVISEQEIIDSLYSDLQTMLYAFCTYLGEGRLPNQVIYNVIRRSTKYRQNNESLKAYLDRVEEDIVARPDFYFTRYEVWISKEDMDQFVNRTLNPILALFIEWWDSIKKNPLKEDRIKQNPIKTLSQGKLIDGIQVELTKGRWSSPYHYLNSTALVAKYGKVDMWDAIFGDVQQYYVRDEVYPELEESILDLFVEQETNILEV